jgi:cytochrome c5
MAGENQFGQYWNPLLMEPVLSEQEKQLRDRFVTEYLLDYDAWAACVRVGFLKSVAGQYASDFMQEPYVQREINRRQMGEDADPKGALKNKKRAVEMALLREAHYKGADSTHSARVSALSKLCNIYDMHGATKVKATVTHKGGVMMVPAIANVADWEKQAAQHQDKLIADSQEDRQNRPVH